MKTKFHLILILFSLFGLIGCGNNGANNNTIVGDNNSNDNSIDKNITIDRKITIRGKVIDAEIKDATIFLDLDRDGELDSGEPFTKSREDGSYELILTQANQQEENYKNQTAPLVVFGGRDIRTNKEFEDYLVSMINGRDKVNITPFTTLIATSLEDENDSVVSKLFSETLNKKTTQEIANELKEKIDKIKNNLSELFEIDKNLLEDDPIELAKKGNITLLNLSLQLHNSAKTMKRAMKKGVRKLKRSILKSYRVLGRELRKIKKSAFKEKNEPLLEVVDRAMSDKSIFDSNLVEEVKVKTKTVIQTINNFWKNQDKKLDDDILNRAITEVDIIVKETIQTSTENSSNSSTTTDNNSQTSTGNSNSSTTTDSNSQTSTENSSNSSTTTDNNSQTSTENSNSLTTTDNNSQTSTENSSNSSTTTDNNSQTSTENSNSSTTTDSNSQTSTENSSNSSTTTDSNSQTSTGNSNSSTTTDSNSQTSTENSNSQGSIEDNNTTSIDNNDTNVSGRVGCSYLTPIVDDSNFTDIFPSNNIEYSAKGETVKDIEEAFNKAREKDPTVTKALKMPSQDIWNSMTIQEKGLFLLNAERYDRGIKPFEGISPDVVKVAQDYANLLYSTGKFGHNEDGTPWDRLDRIEAIKNNKDFLGFAENLYVAGASNDYTKNPIAKAIYNWIYRDKGSSWGHRKFCLVNNLKDNSGESGKEGLIGFGLKKGDSYALYPNFKSTIVVMNGFDPSDSWNNKNIIGMNCNSSSSTENNETGSIDENVTDSTENNTTTSIDTNSTNSIEDNTTVSTDENSTNLNDNNLSETNNSLITIDDSMAIRFLNKATFGATKESIEELKSRGVEAWLDEQLSMPLNDNQYLIKTIEIAKKMNPNENSYTIDEYLDDNDIVFNKNVASFHSPRYRMTAWFDIALRSPDQLRAKVTYALSQIIVESDFEPIFTRRAEALATYFDILQRHAFGKYEDLLNEISFNSGMGVFLTFNGSKKEYKNEANTTVYPDENYAREIMQLFSLGLKKLNIDGTPILDSNGNPIPTYTQEDVNQLARVFTGWDLKRNQRFGLVGFKRGDYTHPLEFTEKYHDNGEKRLLGETIPAGLSGEEDIQKAVSIIMSQSSVAPYISKNLIMRLVKSNPTPSYIARVASVFNSTKGDLKAVTKAIFLDKELWEDLKEKRVVKFKEPLVAYTSFLRAFNVKPFPKWFYCGYGGPTDESASNCQVVEDAFLFNDTRNFLNQGPGLAPTVFNFYDNSFIPNSQLFKESKSVAPEISIMNDTTFINFSNTIKSSLFGHEKNYLLNDWVWDYSGNNQPRKQYKTIIDYVNDAPKRGYIPFYYVGANKFLLDASEELNIMEKVIDGDTNGDFINLKDYRDKEYKDDEKAVDALVHHLNLKLTGGLINQKRESIIANGLKDKIFNKYNVGDPNAGNIDESGSNKKRQLLNNVIFPAIRAIVTSSEYMTE